MNQGFRLIGVVLILILGQPDLSFALPAPPQSADHPGSAVYPYEIEHRSIEFEGRKVDVFLPLSHHTHPVVVYGHGQGAEVDSYDLTLKHLAGKGVIAIHPMYDEGYFDKDFKRMAKDFNSLTNQTLEFLKDRVDFENVVYAGHSKGGLVALMAAGAPPEEPQVSVKSLVLFAPAGYNKEYLTGLSKNLKLTVVWGEAELVIPRSVMKRLFEKIPVESKQFIEVLSYSGQDEKGRADHFFPLNKAMRFGGFDGVNPFHYYGAWKWLLGAADDQWEDYLYGAKAIESGEVGLLHKRW